MTSNVEQEIERILFHLREKMRQKDWSQLEVQEELGWGRSYISQLMTQQKMLRVEQISEILRVIGVAPAQFYMELYGKDWDAWESEMDEWDEVIQAENALEEDPAAVDESEKPPDNSEWVDDELEYDESNVVPWWEQDPGEVGEI